MKFCLQSLEFYISKGTTYGLTVQYHCEFSAIKLYSVNVIVIGIYGAENGY